MLSANLFRALPPSRGADQENYDPDEEEPTLEPTWPHLQVHSATDCGDVRAMNTVLVFDTATACRAVLWVGVPNGSVISARSQAMTRLALTVGAVLRQIVYEFLLRYVVCQDTDAKAAKKYIDQVAVNV